MVGIVEFEHADNVAEWPERVASGLDLLRVETSIWPEYLEGAVAARLRTGDVLEPRGLVTMGPLKVVVDGSLNTRTAWCWDPYPGIGPDAEHPCGVATVPPEELRRLLRHAIPHGIAPAVHAIGDRANTEVLDIFAEFGVAGRIEHAQLVRSEDFARFGTLGVTASVQPEHAMDDRDVADRHWEGRTDRAFALRSLHEGGATLRFGSDAPVAPLDPWIWIDAATRRRRVDVNHGIRSSGSPRSRPRREHARKDHRIGGRCCRSRGSRPRSAGAGFERLRELPVSGTLLAGRWTWRGL
ncbi:amidohydrolase family protein [Microbacterium sp. NIBRBAC000506063]|uniref:amidohydrolase family protein n=1 Tax=Microbacterium sp. NIBRBAC000506063 TaxID=2734618 RepID=UPI0021D4655D|nr:amidohydrolase family protein [Microbacterium sp. NIBRBAC000506063]